jgi:hypothetical protein
MRRLSTCLLSMLFLVSPVQGTDDGCVYGVVMDRSGSMRGGIDLALRAARLLVEKTGPQDRSFVILFADNSELYAEVTDQKPQLLEQLNTVFVSGYPSRVLDALFLSAEELRKSAPTMECRALVLISDVDEQDSHSQLEDVIGILREERVRAFVIGFPQFIPEVKGQKARDSAIQLSERLARSTGGGFWFPRTDAEVMTAVNEILQLAAQPFEQN